MNSEVNKNTNDSGDVMKSFTLTKDECIGLEKLLNEDAVYNPELTKLLNLSKSTLDKDSSTIYLNQAAIRQLESALAEPAKKIPALVKLFNDAKARENKKDL